MHGPCRVIAGCSIVVALLAVIPMSSKMMSQCFTSSVTIAMGLGSARGATLNTSTMSTQMTRMIAPTAMGAANLTQFGNVRS